MITRRAGGWKLTWLPVGAAVLLPLPLWLSSYALHLTNLALVHIILVLGLNFILGWAGQISLAPAAFFGVGAYTSALLTVDAGWSVWAAMAASVLTTGVMAAIVGVPTLRLKSHYFAMATLGLAEIVRLVLQNWKELTHGADGVVNIPAPGLGPVSFATKESYFYLLLAAVGLALLVARRVQCSKFGRAFLAVRQSELAAALTGVNVAAAKMQAFLLSAVYSGLAGSLYAHLFSYISPDIFNLELTVVIYAMLVVGGEGSLAGSVLGAVLLTFLPEWLRFLKEVYMVIYGAGIVVALVFMPFGIVPLLRGLAVRMPVLRLAGGAGGTGAPPP